MHMLSEEANPGDVGQGSLWPAHKIGHAQTWTANANIKSHAHCNRKKTHDQPVALPGLKLSVNSCDHDSPAN